MLTFFPVRVQCKEPERIKRKQQQQQIYGLLYLACVNLFPGLFQKHASFSRTSPFNPNKGDPFAIFPSPDPHPELAYRNRSATKQAFYTKITYNYAHSHCHDKSHVLILNLTVTQLDYVGGLLCTHVLILKSDHHSSSCKGRKASQSVALDVLG